MTKKRIFTIISLTPLALILTFLAIMQLYFLLSSHEITISKETTHILAPINEDGTVDYIAYMNAEHSKGVTKENNAAIPLIEILGPSCLPEDGLGEKICKILKIEFPVENDKQFSNLESFASEENDTLDDSLAEAMKAPWATEQHPEIAQWIEANQHALTATANAVQRTEYYIPAVTPDDAEFPVVNMSIPAVQAYVSMSNALCARAMLKLNSNDTSGAWADAMTAKRLARHIARGYSLVEGLVALRCEDIACNLTDAIAGSGKLTETQAKACLDDLQQLGPLRDIADMIDHSERFMVLDSILKTASTTKLPGWDKVLIKANSYYDSLTIAFRKNTFKVRIEALEDHRRLGEELTQNIPRSFIDMVWKSTTDPAGLTGDLLFTVLLPTVSRSMTLRDRTTAQGDLSTIAMALAAYNAEKNAYPEKLSQLAPGYLKKVPDDLFIDKPFGYTKTAKGYLLYSVGENMKYDGPKKNEDDDIDDIVVEVE
ncbi:MAG: hypothetical protein HN350_03805 [Phycisphaerales bacterium]|jgi:hypothetical protein|nr:hypothetical protein [Phycisphaerales bacterium]